MCDCPQVDARVLARAVADNPCFQQLVAGLKGDALELAQQAVPKLTGRVTEFFSCQFNPQATTPPQARAVSTEGLAGCLTQTVLCLVQQKPLQECLWAGLACALGQLVQPGPAPDPGPGPGPGGATGPTFREVNRCG